MQKETVEITTEFITMDKLLKFSGVADTGGQVAENLFLVLRQTPLQLHGPQLPAMLWVLFPYAGYR